MSQELILCLPCLAASPREAVSDGSFNFGYEFEQTQQKLLSKAARPETCETASYVCMTTVIHLRKGSMICFLRGRRNQEMKRVKRLRLKPNTLNLWVHTVKYKILSWLRYLCLLTPTHSEMCLINLYSYF